MGLQEAEDIKEKEGERGGGAEDHLVGDSWEKMDFWVRGRRSLSFFAVFRLVGGRGRNPEGAGQGTQPHTPPLWPPGLLRCRNPPTAKALNPG